MSALYDDKNILIKASSVITARNGGVVLEPHDKSFFNYLLFRAHNELAPGTVYRVPMKEVMDYVGVKRVKDLHSSLQRLAQGTLEIDYIESDGEARCILAHYLSADMSSAENGMLLYAFDPILYHFLANPKVYAKLYIDRQNDMKTWAAKSLYEIMALQYRKKDPVYRATPDELRGLFAVGDAHPRPDNFRKFVEKTVEQVNALAEFDILVDYVKGGKGGGIVEVVFKAVSKSHARLVEASATKLVGARKVSGPADRQTIDLLDGKNYEERGMPATLSMAAFEAARDMAPEGTNVDDYVNEWSEQGKNKSFSDPDRAFLAWLQHRIEKDADPLLKDLDPDVFGSILGE